MLPYKMMECMRISIIECSQQNGYKPNKRGHKLRSGVYWQGELKHKGMKQVVCITSAVCVHTPEEFFIFVRWVVRLKLTINGMQRSRTL